MLAVFTCCWLVVSIVLVVIGEFQGFGVNLLISGSYYGYVVLVSFMKVDSLGSPTEILELWIVCRIPR